MPTYEENERNNSDSRTSQGQRRIYNQYAENLISPEEQKYLSDLKTARATGYFNNTKDTRKAKEEIRRLEAKQDRNLEQLNQIFNQVKTTSTGGGNNNRDVSRKNETSMPTFAERERASGLSNTNSNRFSEPAPTMGEREAAAGLTNTTQGRDNVQGGGSSSSRETGNDGLDGGGNNGGGGGVDTMSSRDNDPLPVEEPEPEPSTIGVILCVNGSPVSASIYGQIGGTLT
tara:strand:+ start:1175 stop:1864 length:690 start_codon:yes stop_codon:yes gene_type:complete